MQQRSGTWAFIGSIIVTAFLASNACGQFYPIPSLPSAHNNTLTYVNRANQNSPSQIAPSPRPLPTVRYGASSLSHAHHQGADLCTPHIARLEAQEGIPPHLLKALSLVESGRSHNGQKVAWPWTINAEGKSYFFPNKQQAIKTVRELQARGVESIDVGCMQINLKHHKSAFRDLNSAFDPHQNVAYAVEFLKSLKGNSPTWLKAVGNYHSATPEHHIPYRQRVVKEWTKERLQKGTRGNDPSLSPSLPGVSLATARPWASPRTSNNLTARPALLLRDPPPQRPGLYKPQARSQSTTPHDASPQAKLMKVRHAIKMGTAQLPRIKIGTLPANLRGDSSQKPIKKVI